MPDSPLPASIRSKEQLLAFVAARHVDTNPEYAPGRLDGAPHPGLTWCNKYVRGLLKDLEVPFPDPLESWLANQQIDWLGSPAGEAEGWSPCSSGEAVAFANKGQPAIVTYRNPKNPPDGHSHIALVIPSESTLRPHITQAGVHNYLDCPVERGFGNLPVLYYWHL